MVIQVFTILSKEPKNCMCTGTLQGNTTAVSGMMIDESIKLGLYTKADVLKR